MDYTHHRYLYVNEKTGEKETKLIKQGDPVYRPGWKHYCLGGTVITNGTRGNLYS